MSDKDEYKKQLLEKIQNDYESGIFKERLWKQAMEIDPALALKYIRTFTKEYQEKGFYMEPLGNCPECKNNLCYLMKSKACLLHVSDNDTYVAFYIKHGDCPEQKDYDPFAVLMERLRKDIEIRLIQEERVYSRTKGNREFMKSGCVVDGKLNKNVLLIFPAGLLRLKEIESENTTIYMIFCQKMASQQLYEYTLYFNSGLTITVPTPDDKTNELINYGENISFQNCELGTFVWISKKDCDTFKIEEDSLNVKFTNQRVGYGTFPGKNYIQIFKELQNELDDISEVFNSI